MIKKYLKNNIVPIFIELMIVIFWFIVPIEYYIYVNFGCFILMLIYLLYKREISIKSWILNLKSGKKFWKQTILTFICFCISYGITNLLEYIFPNFDTGFTKLIVTDWFSLIAFGISTLILPAVIEETFFRKNLIEFKSKKILILTTLFSMFLFAITHAVKIWGIFLVMIWAIPLSISYIKTKNVYVPMTAHFMGSMVNIVAIINAIMYLCQN